MSRRAYAVAAAAIAALALLVALLWSMFGDSLGADAAPADTGALPTPAIEAGELAVASPAATDRIPTGQRQPLAALGDAPPTLTVRVEDTRGRPLAAAGLRVEVAGGRTLFDAEIDSAGAVVPLPIGAAAVVVRAEADGRLPAVETVALELGVESHPELTLRSQPGGRVSFAVTSAGGAPARDVVFGLSAPGDPAEDELGGFSEAERIVVLGLVGTRVRVELESAAYGRAVTWVELPPSEPPVTLEPVAVGGAGRIAGVLRLTDGRSLDDVELRAELPDPGAEFGRVVATTRADALGRFAFEHLAAGEFDLSVAPDLDPLGTTRLAAGPGDVGLEWVSPAALVGVTAAERSGESRDLYELRVSDGPGFAALGAQGSARDARAGRMLLLPRERTFYLEADVAGDFEGAGMLTRGSRVERVFSALVPSSLETVRQVTLRPAAVAAPARLELEIVGRDGYGALSFTVHLTGPEGALEREAELDVEAQRAAVFDLPEGEYRWSVRAREDGATPLTAHFGGPSWIAYERPGTVLLRPGYVTRLPLSLRRNGQLVVDLRGAAATGASARVVVRGADGDRALVFDGAVPLGDQHRFYSLPVARYRVDVDAPGMPPWTDTCDLEDPLDRVARPWTDTDQ